MRITQPLLLFVYFSCHISLSQADSLLGKFTAQKYQNSVLLSWSIKSGSTCNGIEIYRSEDGIQFYLIGDIQGVCGSSSNSVGYSFTDTFPVSNKINYYRLKLGSIGNSSVISIEFIVIGESGSYIKPNPIIDVADIYFSNPGSQNFSFVLFDYRGNEVMRKTDLLTDYFLFERGILVSGTYIYQILHEGEIKSIGKLVLL